MVFVKKPAVADVLFSCRAGTVPKYSAAMHRTLPPLRFAPIYRDYVWGGDTLARRYGRKTGGGVCAESWEISCFKDGTSVVDGGPFSGVSLDNLLREEGSALVGAGWDMKPFPLLVKLLDARERLSVQVHPDEQTAARSGGEPKTEAWHIIAAEPGAGVHAGFRAGVTQSDFDVAMRENRVEELLQWIPVNAGDTIYIPGGRVHAIGAGCLMLEVQQTSNTTYRLHDWGRVGTDGKPRALHLEQGRQAIRWDLPSASPTRPGSVQEQGGSATQTLLECPFFELTRMTLRARITTRSNQPGFRILFAAAGGFHVSGAGECVAVEEGGTVLLPASLREVSLQPDTGKTTIIRITPRL